MVGSSVFVVSYPADEGKTERRFISCWTENETIFLTTDLDKAETHRTAESALRYCSRVRDHAKRFLADEDERDLVVHRPSLQAVRADKTYTVTVLET